jgi:pimeloyl-ACP methyl ester carboxylesterase
MSADPSVVVVHGIWMTGLELSWLRRRLADCGFRPFQFRYRSLRADLAADAAGLNAFLAGVPGTTVHFVGHSLGGLVIRRLFLDFPDQRPGRIVTLGTPHRPCRVAEFLCGSRSGRPLLGRSAPALTEPLPAWDGTREMGALGGTRSLGIGRLFRVLPTPNDGTVALDEAWPASASDRIAVPTSHMGMVANAEVARQTCHFLHHGTFSHA